MQSIPRTGKNAINLKREGNMLTQNKPIDYCEVNSTRSSTDTTW